MTAEIALPADPRFAATFAVVEHCRHETKFLLWQWWHLALGVSWQQDTWGTSARVWEAPPREGRPANHMSLTVWWALIAGKRVAFVDDTEGWVWDRAIAAAWVTAAFPNAVVTANVDNFHNIVRAIEEAIGETIGRNPLRVEQALRGLADDPQFRKGR